MNRPRVVDLFCGAGGLALGFHAGGYKIAAALDHDDVAARTFESNFSRLQPDCPPRVFGGSHGGDIRNEAVRRELEDAGP